MHREKPLQAREEAAARCEVAIAARACHLDRRRELEALLRRGGLVAVRRRLLVELQAVNAMIRDLDNVIEERSGELAVAIARHRASVAA